MMFPLFVVGVITGVGVLFIKYGNESVGNWIVYILWGFITLSVIVGTFIWGVRGIIKIFNKKG